MNGVLMIETTTGSPVYHCMWKDGFGVPDMRSPGGETSSSRTQAISLSALLVALRARSISSVGEGRQVKHIKCKEAHLLMMEHPSSSLLSVLISEDVVSDKAARGLLESLTLHFVAHHSEAIKLTATGVVRSLKKAMKPVVAEHVWACIHGANGDLLSALRTVCPATAWVLSSYSPELTLSLAQAPNPSSVRGTDVTEAMSGVLGAYDMATGDDSRVWFEGQSGSTDPERAATVLRLLMSSFRVHRLEFSRSVQHLEHRTASGTCLHALVCEDLYVVFAVPGSLSGSPKVNTAFLPQLLSSEVQSMLALLRFAYTSSIAKAAT